MDAFTEAIEIKLGNSVRNARIQEKDLIGIPQEFLLELEKENDEFYSQFTKTTQQKNCLLFFPYLLLRDK